MHEAKEKEQLARRVLIAQVVIAGAVLALVLGREIPGIVREVRIWRMVGVLPRGSRRCPR
ncbi:hypothetical protein LO772_32705 [Yinghuangia sp. ASG 101]|uniref:hypothetical protein n=1 Tax=Yinghuangia sp. ASG 101 TaxID=2896848 RepID=UPI001E582FBA|nr:hypothetical protein [Yinghuangia sp. ASG 101]UGQ11492.1 hypothetical protein LO772_32705 [Yinghuangia sp. ASG 101]